jgi:S1-C subfamily serine protease
MDHNGGSTMNKQVVGAMVLVLGLGLLDAVGFAAEAAPAAPVAQAAPVAPPAEPGHHAGERRAGRAWWAPVADRGWLGIRLSSKGQLDQALQAEKLTDEWIAVPNLKWLDEKWDGEGALVLEVFRESPAEKAGLLAGDVIVSFNGIRTGSAGELVFVVQRALRGHDGDIEVLRDDEKRRLLVEIGLHPEDARRLEEEAAAKRKQVEATPAE